MAQTSSKKRKTDDKGRLLPLSIPSCREKSNSSLIFKCVCGICSPDDYTLQDDGLFHLKE